MTDRITTLDADKCRETTQTTGQATANRDDGTRDHKQGTILHGGTPRLQKRFEAHHAGFTAQQIEAVSLLSCN